MPSLQQVSETFWNLNSCFILVMATAIAAPRSSTMACSSELCSDFSALFITSITCFLLMTYHNFVLWVERTFKITIVQTRFSSSENAEDVEIAHLLPGVYDEEKIWSHVFGMSTGCFFLLFATLHESRVYSTSCSWAFIAVMVLQFIDDMRPQITVVGLKETLSRQKYRNAVSMLIAIMIISATAVETWRLHTLSIMIHEPSQVALLFLTSLSPFLLYNASTSHTMSEQTLRVSFPALFMVALCAFVVSSLGPAYIELDPENCAAMFLVPAVALLLLVTILRSFTSRRATSLATAFIFMSSVRSANHVSSALAGIACVVDLCHRIVQMMAH